MPARGQRDPAVENAMDKGTEDTKCLLHDYFEMQAGKQSGYWREWTMRKTST